MNDDELVHDMYSRLNLIINELNSIGLTKLGDADIVRKIISVLPQKKFVLSILACVALLLSIASELLCFCAFASLDV